MTSVDKEILYTKLGEAIKQARRSYKTNDGKKLTQQELAKKLGIKRTSITNIEAGNQYPPLHIIYEVCIFFNIQLRELLPTLTGVQLNSIEEVTLNDKTVLAPNKTASYVDAFSKKGIKP